MQQKFYFLFCFFNTIEICKSSKKSQTNTPDIYTNLKNSARQKFVDHKRGHCSISCTSECLILWQMLLGWFSYHLCIISFKCETDPNLKTSVSPLWKTHWMSITKANQVIVFRRIIAVLIAVLRKNTQRYTVCAKCRVL